MDNIRAWRVFVAVADARSFTRAAEQLRVAQPAVSATIRALEKEAGAALLNRANREVSLTAAGDRFIQHARAILAHQASSLAEVRAASRLEFGTLTVGAPPMVAGFLLPAVVDAFMAQYPDIQVTIVQAGAEDIARQIFARRIDIGLVAGVRRTRGLVTRLLERHPIVACAARGSRLGTNSAATWPQLLTERLIAFPTGYYQRTLLDDAARRLRVKPRIALETESIPLMAQLVARGRGVATMLRATAELLPDIRVVSLPKDAEVPVALCRASGPPSPAMVEFERMLNSGARH